MRLDSHWKKRKAEVPHLEPAPWIGWDRTMFATDYPHWDFYDPRYARPPGLSPGNRRFSPATPRVFTA